jgi:hypothetical protein
MLELAVKMLSLVSHRALDRTGQIRSYPSAAHLKSQLALLSIPGITLVVRPGRW